ncbi:MAG: VanZ family protein [Planctomycetes bacterium]|nr:VanZ family protein [Planctomycetota bacterium]MCC7398915.1 VanZ family protein [Planctomycetota bacterium]
MAVRDLPPWLDAVTWAWLRAPWALRWSLPVAVMGALWWLSSRQPQPHATSQLSAFLHNGAHVIAYATLAGFTWLALACAEQPRRRFLVAFLIAVAYGVLDEVHQSCVPGRVSSIADLITDGVAAAMALAWLRHHLLRGPRPAFRAVPWLSSCAAAVAFATWGPW